MDFHILAAAKGIASWKAAKRARYGGAKADLMSRASQLLSMSKIQRAIQVRTSDNSATVASYLDRQEFLTDVMNSGLTETRDKLRACELLAKSSGDYLLDVQRSNIRDVLEREEPETEEEALLIQEALTHLDRPQKWIAN